MGVPELLQVTVALVGEGVGAGGVTTMMEMLAAPGDPVPPERAPRPPAPPPDPATWGTDPAAQAGQRAMMAAMPKAKRR